MLMWGWRRSRLREKKRKREVQKEEESWREAGGKEKEANKWGWRFSGTRMNWVSNHIIFNRTEFKTKQNKQKSPCLDTGPHKGRVPEETWMLLLGHHNEDSRVCSRHCRGQGLGCQLRGARASPISRSPRVSSMIHSPLRMWHLQTHQESESPCF